MSSDDLIDDGLAIAQPLRMNVARFGSSKRRLIFGVRNLEAFGDALRHYA
jgi:hypothetical protein